MSTDITPPHFFLASGHVAIVEPVRITDPAFLPTGAEPGIWAETRLIEDEGARPLRYFDLDLPFDEPLVLDPPVDDRDGPTSDDIFHVDAQYAA